MYAVKTLWINENMMYAMELLVYYSLTTLKLMVCFGTEQESRTLRVNDIHELVHQLPESNFEMLDVLVAHLCKWVPRLQLHTLILMLFYFVDHFSYCSGFSGRADVNEAMFLISRSQLVDEGRMRFRLRESLSWHQKGHQASQKIAAVPPQA